MHIWNVLHAARWKYRMQNIARNSPYRHHRTTLLACIFATKACISSWKKIAKCQYLLHMSPQYGELRPITGWDTLMRLRHHCTFQRVSRVSFVTAATSLNGGQPNFAWCLAVSWTGTLCIHFQRLLPRDRILYLSLFAIRQQENRQTTTQTDRQTTEKKTGKQCYTKQLI